MTVPEHYGKQHCQKDGPESQEKHGTERIQRQSTEAQAFLLQFDRQQLQPSVGDPNSRPRQIAQRPCDALAVIGHDGRAALARPVTVPVAAMQAFGLHYRRAISVPRMKPIPAAMPIDRHGLSWT